MRSTRRSASPSEGRRGRRSAEAAARRQRPSTPAPTRSRSSSKRIMCEVVLNEEKGNFKFGQATMPDTVTPELDQLVQQLKANPNGAFIEIEGHTDDSRRQGDKLQDRSRARREREALPV